MMFKKSKLHNAIMDGNILRMKELLDLGTNPDHADDYGRTFLWFAINRGNLAAVMVLVDNGATVSVETRYRGSLLQTAAEKGSVEIAEYLLSKNPELLNLKDRDGNNALHTAATAGYPDMLAFLIEKGLDPNDKNFSNRTPLAIAQKGGHAEAIEVLKPYTPARSRALPRWRQPPRRHPLRKATANGKSCRASASRMSRSRKRSVTASPRFSISPRARKRRSTATLNQMPKRWRHAVSMRWATRRRSNRRWKSSASAAAFPTRQA